MDDYIEGFEEVSIDGKSSDSDSNLGKFVVTYSLDNFWWILESCLDFF